MSQKLAFVRLERKWELKTLSISAAQRAAQLPFPQQAQWNSLKVLHRHICSCRTLFQHVKEKRYADRYFTLEVGIGPWVVFQDILLQRCGRAGLRFIHGRNSRQDGVFHQSPTQQGLLPWFLQLFSKEEEKSIKTKFSQTRSGQAPLHQVGRRSCISTDTFYIKTLHRERCSPSFNWEDRPIQSTGLECFFLVTHCPSRQIHCKDVGI